MMPEPKPQAVHRTPQVDRERAVTNEFPKLHNAMWPGIVGKGTDAEPVISFETLLELTAATVVEGQRFDGVDLFLAEPHTSIDSTEDDLKRLADTVAAKGLVIGSLVAPVWPPVMIFGIVMPLALPRGEVDQAG